MPRTAAYAAPLDGVERGHRRSFRVQADQRLAGGDEVAVLDEPLDDGAAVRRGDRRSRPAGPATSPTWRRARGRCASAGQVGAGGRCPWPARPASARSGWCRCAMRSPCLSKNARASSSWSGVLRANVSTPFSARLAMPVRVPAGGISSMPVTPRSSIVSMHRSQRTGCAIWLTMRLQHLAAVVDDLAVAVGDPAGSAASWVETERASRREVRRRPGPCARCGTRRRPTAGPAGPWPAGRRRRPAAARRCRRRRSGRGRCRWPRSGRARSSAASTSSRSPPRTAVMLVGVVGGGRGHRVAALADQHHRLLGGDRAGRRRRRRARRRCGRRRRRSGERVGRVREQLEGGEQAGGDQQRLGDGGVADRLGVGLGAVVGQVDAGDGGQPAGAGRRTSGPRARGSGSRGSGRLGRERRWRARLHPAASGCPRARRRARN